MNYFFTSCVALQTGDLSWDGMVGDLVARRADFTCGDLTHTRERQFYVDFSVPLFTDSAQLHISNINPSTHWDAYFDVFDKEFWIVLSTFVIIFMAGIFVLTKMLAPNTKTQDVLEESASVPLKAIGNLDIGQWPTIPAKAVLVLVLSLFGCVLKETYSGSLMSTFTVKDYTLPFHTLKELAEDSEYTLYFCSRGIGMQHIMNSSAPWMKKVTRTKILPFLASQPERFDSGEKCQSDFFAHDGTKKVIFVLRSGLIGMENVGHDTCSGK